MADLKLSLIIRGVEKGAKSLLKGVKGQVKSLNAENTKAAGVQKLVARSTQQTTVALTRESAAMLRFGATSEAAMAKGAAGAGKMALGVAKLAGRITGVIALLGALAAAAALVAAPIGLARFTLGQAKSAAQLGREATALKVGVGKLQELREAFRMNEQEPEKATDLFKALQKAQTGAFRGSKEQVTAFRSIGLAIKDQNGQLKPVDKLLGEAADAYAKLQHAQKRQYVAQALFGMAVEDLDPILKDGSKGLEDYAREARRAGLWTQQNVDDAAAARRSWNLLIGSLEGLVRVASGKLFPVLTQVTEALRAWLDDPKNRAALISSITDATKQLSNSLPTLLPKLQGFLTTSTKLMTDVDWKGVADGIVTIAGAIQSVADALATFKNLGGWTALKPPPDAALDLFNKARALPDQVAMARSQAELLRSMGLGLGSPRGRIDVHVPSNVRARARSTDLDMKVFRSAAPIP